MNIWPALEIDFKKIPFFKLSFTIRHAIWCLMTSFKDVLPTELFILIFHRIITNDWQEQIFPRKDFWMMENQKISPSMYHHVTELFKSKIKEGENFLIQLQKKIPTSDSLGSCLRQQEEMQWEERRIYPDAMDTSKFREQINGSKVWTKHEQMLEEKKKEKLRLRDMQQLSKFYQEQQQKEQVERVYQQKHYSKQEELHESQQQNQQLEQQHKESQQITQLRWAAWTQQNKNQVHQTQPSQPELRPQTQAQTQPPTQSHTTQSPTQPHAPLPPSLPVAATEEKTSFPNKSMTKRTDSIGPEAGDGRNIKTKPPSSMSRTGISENMTPFSGFDDYSNEDSDDFGFGIKSHVQDRKMGGGGGVGFGAGGGSGGFDGGSGGSDVGVQKIKGWDDMDDFGSISSFPVVNKGSVGRGQVGSSGRPTKSTTQGSGSLTKQSLGQGGCGCGCGCGT
eukprot:TRINITY_DN6673_c0_g3_i2.p1 TRINITY_DN6673_c0_g3~~TRINITY_DN6673_c0_g3_i2.p1  ORF type:complete len:449 (-),score=138.34 TRINITY_DN6673_c0_g3_i2:751-2097(-)